MNGRYGAEFLPVATRRTVKWGLTNRGLKPTATIMALLRDELCTRRTGTRFSLIVARRSVSVLVVGKGDWLLFVRSTRRAVPAKGACPLFSYRPQRQRPALGRYEQFSKITISNHSIPTANGNINSPAMS